MAPFFLRLKAAVLGASLLVFLAFQRLRKPPPSPWRKVDWSILAEQPVGLRGDHPPAFVRVVVRTHEKQLLELRSLIYSLRGQAQRLRWLKLDFVLVPTEPGAQATYRALTQELNAGFDDVQLLDVPDAFYAEAKASNPYKCTEKDRDGYLAKLGSDSMARMCDYDQYVYYAATDRALEDFVGTCSSCTHVLVTNGDNGYAPEFVAAATSRQEEVVIVGFTHSRIPVTPKVELGWLDLGAVLLRKRVLEDGRRVFLTSLPPGARAREVHDADFWFVRNAVDSGFSYALIGDRILMYHH